MLATWVGCQVLEMEIFQGTSLDRLEYGRHYIYIERPPIKGVRTLFFSRKVLSYQDLDSENQDFYSENQSTDSDFQKMDSDNQSTDADNQSIDVDRKRSLTLIITGHL